MTQEMLFYETKAGTHYNTTNLTGQKLSKAKTKAKTQEEIILAFFSTAGKGATPSQVMQIASNKGYNWPIKSIRRAMTVLTGKGVLEKTLEKRPGAWGADEHVWRRASK
jgi:Fe2+ or Zn2+ uptake regulation protein